MLFKKCIVSVVVASICFTMISYGEEQTTSALIALYNDSIYVPSQEEMDELARQITEYNVMVNRNEVIHNFNDAVDDAESYRELLMEETKKQLDDVLCSASLSVNNINCNIYGDINELIKYDSEYKTSVRQANYLMEQMNKFSVTGKMLTLDEDIEAKKEEIENRQKELTMPDIQVVEGEFLLGEVYNCKSPAAQEYSVNSAWGSRISPITGTSIEYHNGIDLYAPEGTDVYSIFNGRVLESGDNWALGKYVRIQHGSGVVSVYGHLSQLVVRTGDYVTQYQKIGESGNTGNRTTGAHLHFGLFINGQSVDPGVLLRNAKKVQK